MVRMKLMGSSAFKGLIIPFLILVGLIVALGMVKSKRPRAMLRAVRSRDRLLVK